MSWTVTGMTNYETVINLKTAKALNLEVPPSLLARVIEPVSRLPVRILKFTEQRPGSEKRLLEGR